MMRCQASGYLLPGTATLLICGATTARKSLVGSASTVSGLCPIAGPTECVSPVQCAAYDAQKHINRRSTTIFATSHAEGRWFEPSRDHSIYAAQIVF